MTWKMHYSIRGSIFKTTDNINISRFIAFLALYFLFFTNPAFGNPAIVNIQVHSKRNVVTTNARLVNGFTEDILEAINNGIPMTFTYAVELRKLSSFWIDSLVSSNTISNTVQYDSLKKAYRISSIGRGVQRKIITHDINRLRRLMLSLKDIPVASMRKLSKNERYYVRVKADLETDRFWFPFNYIFFFVPFNDVKTAWAESSPLAWQPDRKMAIGPVIRKTPRKKSGSPNTLNHVIRTFN